MTAGVYLLHFTTAYKHARHYIGYSYNVEERIADHLAGKGARLPQVVVKAGITIIIARIWPGADRSFERKLHRQGSRTRYCPLCNPKSFHRNAPCYAVKDQDVDM